jgi:hypothetical protein
MSFDANPDSLREAAAQYSPPEPTQRLIDDLYRQELIEARMMSPSEKVYSHSS